MTDAITPSPDSDVEPDPQPAEDPEVARKLLGRIDVTNAIVLPLLAFVSALIIGTLIIALSDVDKLGDGDFGGIVRTIFDSYKALIEGAFFSLNGLSETITAMTPLLLAGLAVAITFRTGLFNIGGTGQMLIGGMGAVYVGFSMSGPGWLQVPLAVVAGQCADRCTASFPAC